MKNKPGFALLFILVLASFQLAMGSREGQYDEEARAEERQEKIARKAAKESGHHPVKNFAGGIKQATVDSTTGFIGETTEGASEGPVTGTLEGARQGSQEVLDNTVKGAVKVATLGYGNVENYEVQEPEKGSDEPTKIKIKIPGT